MRVQCVRLHLKDLIFEIKMRFLSQADKLLVSTHADKCEYVFEKFPWCVCSCCMLTCAKKAERVQFGGSVSQTVRDSNSTRHSRTSRRSDVSCHRTPHATPAAHGCMLASGVVMLLDAAVTDLRACSAAADHSARAAGR